MASHPRKHSSSIRPKADDHLVGDLAAVALGNLGQAVDADAQAYTGRGETGGDGDCLIERGAQPRAVEVAGQRIEGAGIGKTRFSGGRPRDPAQASDHAHGAALARGDDDTAVLDPGERAVAAPQPIGAVIGPLAADVTEQRAGAGGQVGGGDASLQTPRIGDFAEIGESEQLGRAVGPYDLVAEHVPIVNGVARGRKDKAQPLEFGAARAAPPAVLQKLTHVARPGDRN